MSKDKKKKKKTLASEADKYELYEKSVQAPDFESEFFAKVYKKTFGRAARVLREDFCGTHAVCCEWVKDHKENQAIGVDLDPEPLAWGIVNNQSFLEGHQRERIELIKADVRDDLEPKADVVAGENFSYFIFKTREDLLGYFKAAYGNLKEQGILMLDFMGGADMLEEDQQEERKFKGFKYIWEQKRFDPISHDVLFYIHFKFPDGSKLKKAFEYDWRLWTIPEVRELLLEAGFAEADVYWEGTDPETNEGSSEYRKRSSAPAEPTYIPYIVGVKK